MSLPKPNRLNLGNISEVGARRTQCYPHREPQLHIEFTPAVDDHSLSSRRTLQVNWAVMDDTETTHIVFPEQTLHWVATEASRRDSNAVYCGVGSYFLPNDIAAARRLRWPIEEYGPYRHTAKQKPSCSEALSLRT